MTPVIEAIDVSKRFMLYRNRSISLKERFLGLVHHTRRQVAEEFWALKGISTRVGHGEALGVIGRNGSGKSTFLKLIAGIHRPTTGRLLVSRGAQIGTMIELGLGFHAELSGTENVFLNAAIHGLGRQEIEAIYDDVVEYSGLRHFMDVPLKNYSSGMHMRLAFAIAANLDPDILLLDEIFAVGDEDFQKQCVGTMQRFAAAGKTIVFVSHTPAAVLAICQRVIVLDHGRAMFEGPTQAGLDEYHRLLAADAPGPQPAAELLTPAWAAGPGAADALDRDLDSLYAEFLLREGLASHHYLLDIDGGGPSSRPALVRHLSPGHYVAVDGSQGAPAIAADAGSPQFEYALAPSLFPRLTLNRIARCMAVVLRLLAPGGRFYATYYENPKVGDFEPIVRSDGSTTFADAEPYHYAFETLAQIAGGLGAQATRIGDFGHPRGEMMVVITPRHP